MGILDRSLVVSSVTESMATLAFSPRCEKGWTNKITPTFSISTRELGGAAGYPAPAESWRLLDGSRAGIDLNGRGIRWRQYVRHRSRFPGSPSITVTGISVFKSSIVLTSRVFSGPWGTYQISCGDIAPFSHPPILERQSGHFWPTGFVPGSGWCRGFGAWV